MDAMVPFPRLVVPNAGLDKVQTNTSAALEATVPLLVRVKTTPRDCPETNGGLPATLKARLVIFKSTTGATTVRPDTTAVLSATVAAASNGSCARTQVTESVPAEPAGTLNEVETLMLPPPGTAPNWAPAMLKVLL